MLLVGDGDRQNECAHYGGPDGCLTRFLRAHPRAQEGHCPPACSHFAAPDPLERFAAAQTYGHRNPQTI